MDADQGLTELRSGLAQPTSSRWRFRLPQRAAPRPALLTTITGDDGPEGLPADRRPGTRAFEHDARRWADDLGPKMPTRRWVASAMVIGGLAALAVVASALRPQAAARVQGPAGNEAVALAPGPAREPAIVDTTVAVRVWPAEPIEVVGRELRTGGHRYLVGQEGDVVAVGDWNCDRLPTPAVLRPATGQISVFDGWAADAVRLARPIITVPGSVALSPAPTCGSVVVRDAAGAQRILDLRSPG